MSAEPINPITGLPASFARMLAVKIDPYSNTKPLDDFFAQLMRAQSFRARAREAAEAFGTPKKRKSLMNSLTKIETKNELAPPGVGDPFTEYADAIAPQYIIGDLLRFSKGDYYAGQNNTLVPMGTVFTVNVDELRAGWVRWWDGNARKINRRAHAFAQLRHARHAGKAERWRAWTYQRRAY
jgi:hypothetical protein